VVLVEDGEDQLDLPMTHKKVLHRVKEEKNNINYKEVRLTGLVAACVKLPSKTRCGRNTEGRIEVKGTRGRRRKQPLDGHNEKSGYCKLKQKTLDRTVWRSRFGISCGPLVQND